MAAALHLHGEGHLTEQQPSSSAPARGPMTGVRVIDLGTMFAGPFAASLLGDFGADVIKVELPEIGDCHRGMLPVVQGVPGPWTILARNKRSISLDIRKDKGKEILKQAGGHGGHRGGELPPGHPGELGAGLRRPQGRQPPADHGSDLRLRPDRPLRRRRRASAPLPRPSAASPTCRATRTGLP